MPDRNDGVPADARQAVLPDGRTVAVYGPDRDAAPAAPSLGHPGPPPGPGRRSLSILNVGLACCALEVAAAAATSSETTEPTDGSTEERETSEPAPRLRLQPYTSSPGETDVLVVSGTVTDAMAPAVRALYERLAEPRTVISYGACSNSGGPYWDSYAVTKGVDQIIPVDLYVPGCPPRPDALLAALQTLSSRSS